MCLFDELGVKGPFSFYHFFLGTFFQTETGDCVTNIFYQDTRRPIVCMALFSSFKFVVKTRQSQSLQYLYRNSLYIPEQERQIRLGQAAWVA
jgi:hypothetical protein